MLIRTSESGNITMFRAYHVRNHGREGKGEKPSTQETFTEEGKGREEGNPIYQPHHASRPQVKMEKMDTSTHECASKTRLRIIMILTSDSLVGGKWYEYYLEKTSN